MFRVFRECSQLSESSDYVQCSDNFQGVQWFQSVQRLYRVFSVQCSESLGIVHNVQSVQSSECSENVQGV